MKINYHSGVLYDVIFYNVIYFNKDVVRDLLSLYAKNRDDIFEFYDEFRKCKNIIDPPQSLYPFFYFEVGMPCVMSEYLHKSFDFFNGTYEDFFEIFENVSDFKRFVYYYYLEEYYKNVNIEAVIKGNNIEIAKALFLLRKHGERGYAFIKLFYDFENLVVELKDYLIELLHRMKLFHEKYKNLYSIAIDNFIKSENINTFRKNFDIGKNIKFSEQTYAVCFMQRYILLFQFGNERDSMGFILGFESYLSISRYTNYKHVNYITISKIFAHEIMNDIVELLLKEELTITKLSMRLNVSRTTVDRLISLLHDDLAISISSMVGNEKYYKINPEFFLAGQVSFNEKVEQILSYYKRNAG